jgi:hypothetical protein
MPAKGRDAGPIRYQLDDDVAPMSAQGDIELPRLGKRQAAPDLERDPVLSQMPPQRKFDRDACHRAL